ncbi:WhiB family redox-sensing transcriptional regulator [Rhodococcus sp. PvP016]|uniref:Transcriptional regulator WhiB n=2 Tax=Mycobacteriales TaxID=85007 RepID=A0ABS2KR16_9NOCA|nr:WhiB family redox-sensing transcriptional regulator [Rhodococcus corynebacterioides]MBP1116745.1 WhiB family redox-sensing transcriptional regulator [Rhodococcus sp. PvP016]
MTDNNCARTGEEADVMPEQHHDLGRQESPVGELDDVLHVDAVTEDAPADPVDGIDSEDVSVDDVDPPLTSLGMPAPALHLSLVPGDMDPLEDQWQERALCAQTDPEAFFPEKGGSTREAKRICLGCEVKDDCLEYALAHDERFGIWGGLSERERRRLKRGII